MKSDIDKIKENLYREAILCLPVLLNSYQPNDYKKLGEICTRICQIDEYCGRPKRPRLKHEVFVKNFRAQIYKEMTALVLLSGSDKWNYTREEVIKFIRGESLHGDSDARKERRQVLLDFVFEKNTQISLEFAFTYSFVIFPGARSCKGNTDSETPFIQDFNFLGRVIRVSQIESIALNTVIEYLQALNEGMVSWRNRVIISNDLDSFRSVLGDTIVERLLEESKCIFEWKKLGSLNLISLHE